MLSMLRDEMMELGEELVSARLMKSLMNGVWFGISRVDKRAAKMAERRVRKTALRVMFAV